MLYAKLIGRITLFTCENIAHIEFYLQGLLPKFLAIYTIKMSTVYFSDESRGRQEIFVLAALFCE